MVANLIIGRVGLETDLAHPTSLNERAFGDRDQVINLQGNIKETASLIEAKHLRHQLLGQVRSDRQTGMVAVESLGDPSLNGFYILESANLEVSHRSGSLIGVGFFPYSVTLRRLNTELFSSRLTGGILQNDHTVTSGDPFWAPPVSVETVTPEGASNVTRPGVDGNVVAFRSVDETDSPVYSLDPTTPTNLYTGACSLRVARPAASTRRLISGLFLGDQNDPNDWEIENTLCRVQAGTIAGEVEVAMHDGGAGWESNVAFDILNGGSPVGSWDSLIVLHNTPELVTIRLMQERVSTIQGRRILDISLRRGSRFASFFYTTTTAATLKIQRASVDAAITESPYGIRDSANDGDGNRWVLGTRHSHTGDTTNGGIERDGGTQTIFDFFIGHEDGGNGRQTGDDALDLGAQYIHHLAERSLPMVPSGLAI